MERQCLYYNDKTEKFSSSPPLLNYHASHTGSVLISNNISISSLLAFVGIIVILPAQIKQLSSTGRRQAWTKKRPTQEVKTWLETSFKLHKLQNKFFQKKRKRIIMWKLTEIKVVFICCVYWNAEMSFFVVVSKGIRRFCLKVRWKFKTIPNRHIFINKRKTRHLPMKVYTEKYFLWIL